MQQVQLKEELYKEAHCRGETPNLDHVFTPERIARIEAAAEIKAGNCFTAEQVGEHFKQKREAWTQKNGPRTHPPTNHRE